jgi:hypothetical protein
MILELEQVAGTVVPARAASAASLIAAISEAAGALIVVQPGQWAQAASVGFAAQASTSKAANAAARHVCTSICAIFSTGATAQAGAMDVSLRDGASGGGTVLWTQRFILDVNKTLQFILTGLNIPGSLNTAMTLEFAAAGVAGSVESVAMSGYDAS